MAEYFANLGDYQLVVGAMLGAMRVSPSIMGTLRPQLSQFEITRAHQLYDLVGSVSCPLTSRIASDRQTAPKHHHTITPCVSRRRRGRSMQVCEHCLSASADVADAP